MPGSYRYCPECAAPLENRIIHEQQRQACPRCAFIHWRNPVVGVAVIVQRGAMIILGKRARGVYQNAWCIPCGYVEYGEDVRVAAVREFGEETGLTVELGDVYAVHSNFHNPALHSVGIWFRGEIRSGTIRTDDDLAEVEWFSLHQLPEKIAFETDRKVLTQLREELE